jgi:hypothetical protein
MADEKVPMTLTTKKKLTLPIVKFEKDLPRAVKITTAMHVGKQLKGTGDKSKMEPATLCNVIELDNDNREAQMICASIVKSVLSENYENDSYVGLCFSVTKHNKREGKGYYDYSIDEINDPTSQAAKDVSDATTRDTLHARSGGGRR